MVVFSAHWQAEPNEIHLNNAETTDLIYESVVSSLSFLLSHH